MASGVQGMMDLTVPGGGFSVSGVVVVGGGVVVDVSREFGSMKRMLGGMAIRNSVDHARAKMSYLWYKL